jgi:acyl dehydratase
MSASVRPTRVVLRAEVVLHALRCGFRNWIHLERRIAEL